MRIAKSNRRLRAAAGRGLALFDSLEARRLMASTVKVPGTANPWLITGVDMPNPGTQPLAVTLAAGTGRVVSFPTVTGTVTNGTASNGADGRDEKGTVTATGGLSGFTTQAGFFGLVGVFTTDARPSSNPPATLDASTTRSDASFYPKLNQVFFIGDGKTGTGTGTLQKFYVPSGATKLYLGLPDSDQFNGPPGEYADNGGSLSVTVDAPTPSTPQGSSGGSIAGTVFKDTDGDGVKDTNETAGVAGVVLYNDADNDGIKDTGELTATADADGNFKFVSLPAGTYKVRQVLPAGYTQTTPTKNYGISVTLAAGQAVTGKLFGDKPGQPTPPPPAGNTASIAGTVFNDANADKKYGATELGLGLWTVFIDTDKDGKLDTGEKSVVTDVNGTFAFTGLAAGTYSVRAVQVAKTAVTTASSLSVTLTAGQAATGQLFGEKRIA